MKRTIKDNTDGLGPLSHRVAETFKGTTDNRADILSDRVMQLIVGYSDDEIAACFVKHLEASAQSVIEDLKRPMTAEKRGICNRWLVRRNSRLNTWRIMFRTARRAHPNVR